MPQNFIPVNFYTVKIMGHPKIQVGTFKCKFYTILKLTSLYTILFKTETLIYKTNLRTLQSKI